MTVGKGLFAKPRLNSKQSKSGTPFATLIFTRSNTLRRPKLKIAAKIKLLVLSLLILVAAQTGANAAQLQFSGYVPAAGEAINTIASTGNTAAVVIPKGSNDAIVISRAGDRLASRLFTFRGETVVEFQLGAQEEQSVRVCSRKAVGAETHCNIYRVLKLGS